MHSPAGSPAAPSGSSLRERERGGGSAHGCFMYTCVKGNTYVPQHMLCTLTVCACITRISACMCVCACVIV